MNTDRNDSYRTPSPYTKKYIYSPNSNTEFFQSTINNNNISDLTFSKTTDIRYVSTSDHLQLVRREWMNKTFPMHSSYSYRDGDTKCFSMADDDFNVIIFGSNDAVRATNFLKLGKPIVNRKLKIALMTRSTPPRRAQLLSTGYDDVFDTARTTPAEAIARTTSMWGRYNSRIQTEQIESVGRSRLEEVANYDDLSRREKRILEILLYKEGSFASYTQLQCNVSDRAEAISFTHLKVLICELRKKLIKPYVISSRSLLGYELHKKS